MAIPRLAGGSPVGQYQSPLSIANTESIISELKIPANSLDVGEVFRLKAMGLLTNTTTASTGISRARCATSAGVLTGVIPAGVSSAFGAVARTNIPMVLEGMITCRAIGASGTLLGVMMPTVGNATQPVLSAAVTAAVTINTTIDQWLTLTFISGAATTSFAVYAASLVKEFYK